MKRARPWVELRRSPRLTIQCEFPFLELLPEMQGEVIARLVGVRDRACLARSCRALNLKVTLPVLPVYWRDAWTKHIRPRLFSRGLFIDLIDFGILTWPGAAQSHPSIVTEPWDIHIYWFEAFNTTSICRALITNQGGEWRLNIWRLGTHFENISICTETVYSLDDLPMDTVNKWRTIVANSVNQ